MLNIVAQVYFIHDGIKKLRAESAGITVQPVWRGLRDVHIPPALMQSGGSERACMSYAFTVV